MKIKATPPGAIVDAYINTLAQAQVVLPDDRKRLREWAVHQAGGTMQGALNLLESLHGHNRLDLLPAFVWQGWCRALRLDLGRMWRRAQALAERADASEGAAETVTVVLGALNLCQHALERAENQQRQRRRPQGARP